MTADELEKICSGMDHGDRRMKVFVPFVGDLDITGVTTCGQITIPQLTPVQVLALFHHMARLAGERKLPGS